MPIHNDRADGGRVSARRFLVRRVERNPTGTQTQIANKLFSKKES